MPLIENLAIKRFVAKGWLPGLPHLPMMEH
jgi:hypothetical protein